MPARSKDPNEGGFGAMNGEDATRRKGQERLRESKERLDLYDPYGPRVDRESLERRRELELLRKIERDLPCNRC
ncbi:MAG: hypothetical protein M3R38_04675 [Actinomycetota bacterium]|jgi:hypothetical protein|nr:hypothetical protein [Actinomycetota bacterium]